MNRIERLILENEALKTEINDVKKLIIDLEIENRKPWTDIIDKKVELWYEKFKDDDIDISKMPDFIEKSMYKKCIKIIFAMLLELKDN